MRALARELLNLLLPRGCAGCDRPDWVLCPDCQALLADHRQLGLLPGSAIGAYSCGLYRGPVRRAILAWKDHGDEECEPILAEALAQLAVEVLQACPASQSHQSTDRPLLLLPAPSSGRSMRARGRWQMLPLVRMLSRLLRAQGYETRVCRALSLRGAPGKAVQTTGSGQRSQRIKGHVSIRPGIAVAGQSVLLLDDIITTGATMGECLSLLDDAGAHVLGGLALAWTPPPGDTPESGDSLAQ
ncbi:ComF family protein [Bifidobacterium aemilianum]|uniref:ComF family protein n=1 Tax=Bifidobacterium aemilianum TaxID=2493120 RepID=UPI000FDEC5C5|nr:phosphoribosyltransferase family protein [Bifidobacterium aemilianum]